MNACAVRGRACPPWAYAVEMPAWNTAACFAICQARLTQPSHDALAKGKKRTLLVAEDSHLDDELLEGKQADAGGGGG